MKNILGVSLLSIVIFGNTAQADDIDYKSIKIDDFYHNPRNAKFTIFNNVPLNTPPIVLDYMFCEWTYMYNRPWPFPRIMGISITTNLNIQPGQFFTIESDQALCIIRFRCVLQLNDAGSSDTMDFGKDLNIPYGSCLDVANGKIID